MIIFNCPPAIAPAPAPQILSFDQACAQAGADGDFTGLCVQADALWQVLLAAAAKAEFIAPRPEIAARAAELAEQYLFDSKILVLVNSVQDLELAAQLKADAAMLCGAHELALRRKN